MQTDVQSQLDAATKKSLRGLLYEGKPGLVVCVDCHEHVLRTESMVRHRCGRTRIRRERVCMACAIKGKSVNRGKGC